MFQPSAEELAALILNVEERIAQNSFLLISGLRPSSTLLKSRESAIDAFRTFGIRNESDFSYLVQIKNEGCVILKLATKDASTILSKMKMCLEAYFATQQPKAEGEENYVGRVAWISEETLQGILSGLNVSKTGKPL
jgi:hypothetical protein